MGSVGVGRGKLLLLGEHAAVYGHPAVGLSLEDCIRAELELRGEERWSIEGVGREDREAVLEVLALYEVLLPELQRLGRGKIALRASIRRGLGFGSSAALCVALAEALEAAIRKGGDAPPRERIWSLAHQAERLFHGTPSGIDTGLSLLNGLYAFRPQPPELPEARRLPGFALDLVVGAVPRSRKAGSLIGSLRERMRAGDRTTVRHLGTLGRLAAQGITILEQGDAARLGELGELCWQAEEVLRGLGLGHPELDRILAQGRSFGAVGGKLSGAGGGGAFFLLFGSWPEAESAAARIRSRTSSHGGPSSGSIKAFHWRPEH